MKKRHPKTEEDFARLEYKFFALNPQPIAQSAWEVFTTFTVGILGRDVEVEFVDMGNLEGGQPRGGERSREKVTNLVADLVYTPAPQMIKKIVLCLEAERVAYFLHNGLQVVDDLKATLAVHIMRDEQLALNLVQRISTVRATKREAGYVKTIRHRGDWKARVQEVICI